MRAAPHGWIRSPLLGLFGGALFALLFALWLTRTEGPIERAARGAAAFDRPLEIRVNDLPRSIPSLPSLPLHGWTLEIRTGPPTQELDQESLQVELRQADMLILLARESFRRVGDQLTTTIAPGPTPLDPGPLTIRASARDAGGRTLRDELEVELRDWDGRPPMGTGQIIHFDFEIDRNGDGVADFPRDLEAFGLASPHDPRLARRVAERIAARAIERARRAYDDSPAPDTGRPPPSSAATIELRLDASRGGPTTRICVGGNDPSGGDTVGNVRFDPHNADRSSIECDSLPPTGLFPYELETYRADETFRAAFDSLMESRGGLPIGGHPLDELVLSDHFVPAGANAAAGERSATIEHAISVFADALGTIMAHEAAHALGLVAPGHPGEGLFGGRAGPGYAHNLALDGDSENGPWLMDPGIRLSFTNLAGRGEAGELRFRALNRAYLRDRIVLTRPAPTPIPSSAPIIDEKSHY